MFNVYSECALQVSVLIRAKSGSEGHTHTHTHSDGLMSLIKAETLQLFGECMQGANA